MGWRDRGIEIKTPDQIAKMRVAGLLVGETLELLRATVVAGISTARARRDRRAAHPRAPAGCRRSWATATRRSRPRSAPRSTTRSCTASRARGCSRDGDVISIDCGAIVDGWHGDAAITVAVGEVPAEVTELMRVTEELAVGRHRRRAARRPGQRHLARGGVPRPRPGAGRADGAAYGIVEDFTGHGIGTAMHQAPNVPNYGKPGRGPKLERGLALAVEPMVTLGTRAHRDGRRRVDRRSPSTAPGQPTSSTRSPSPPTAPGCSPPSTAAGRAGVARRPLRRGLGRGFPSSLGKPRDHHKASRWK